MRSSSEEWVTELARLLQALDDMRREVATLREELQTLRADIDQERDVLVDLVDLDGVNP